MSKLLHDGASITNCIEAALTLTTEAGTNQYGFQLAHAAGDTLLFTNDWFDYTPRGKADRRPRHMGAGHRPHRGYYPAGVAVLRRIRTLP
ncbi:MAG TPA: hypothetical protein VMU81_31435 [Acetobacteraceae bacterium]|nr:hypothetical protein [Acetobacteraceae bacterium]